MKIKALFTSRLYTSIIISNKTVFNQTTTDNKENKVNGSRVHQFSTHSKSF